MTIYDDDGLWWWWYGAGGGIDDVKDCDVDIVQYRFYIDLETLFEKLKWLCQYFINGWWLFVMMLTNVVMRMIRVIMMTMMVFLDIWSMVIVAWFYSNKNYDEYDE